MTNIKTAISNSGIDLIDAKYLMCFVLEITLSELPLKFDNEITDEQLEKFNKLVGQRISGKPVDIIIGSKHFWKGQFVVNENVLSPRPDSEVIIENVLKHFPDRNKSYRILDLGTGSGALLISLLMEYKNATGIGLDISKQALEIAGENAKINGVENGCKFINSNWFENLPAEQFDIIISNPPYIPTNDINDLSVEVKNYDPKLALDGGVDGLNPYHIIGEKVGNYMSKDSLLFVEFGINQSEMVEKIFNSNGFETLEKSRDLANIVRCHTYNKKST